MITSLKTRLLAPGTPFRIAGGATDLATVKDAPPQSPAVYVFCGTDRSEKDGTTRSKVRQRCTVDISVVIVTTNLSAQHNAAAADDVETLKKFVRGRLLGFVPDGALDPLQHVEGEMQQAIAGTVWFEDVFVTTTWLNED
ncbi:phage tail terminator protein [Shinella sp. G-2]|uniref:phage tail terminator protein n=1 Tax=Shinella sp. G-2 TaxID=3133141 RepID=UPI003D00C6CF